MILFVFSFASTDYQGLVDTVVVDIVRQNCEILTSIEPGEICSSRSKLLTASGQGFGAQKPADGQLKFKVGGKTFDGKKTKVLQCFGTVVTIVTDLRTPWLVVVVVK